MELVLDSEQTRLWLVVPRPGELDLLDVLIEPALQQTRDRKQETSLGCEAILRVTSLTVNARRRKQITLAKRAGSGICKIRNVSKANSKRVSKKNAYLRVILQI